MEAPIHTMPNLFAQLGHASDLAAIENFINTHRPLPAGMALHEAGFWNPSQAAFLREAILQDADWAPVIDELNAELRT